MDKKISKKFPKVIFQNFSLGEIYSFHVASIIFRCDFTNDKFVVYFHYLTCVCVSGWVLPFSDPGWKVGWNIDALGIDEPNDGDVIIGLFEILLLIFSPITPASLYIFRLR